MKYIQKKSEPKELVEWKQQDKMYQRGKPLWNRLPTEVKGIVRQSILEEQGSICCYCEREIGDNDFHTEHLRPQGKGGFPEDQLDYNNLLCSCQKNLEKGEPRQCGNAKGSWYDSKLLVSPLDSNCEQQFEFTIDGHIQSAKDSQAAAHTIDKLELGSDKLNALRKSVLEGFIAADLNTEEMQRFIEYYLKKQKGNKFSAFYTTIQNLSRELVKYAVA